LLLCYFSSLPFLVNKDEYINGFPGLIM